MVLIVTLPVGEHTVGLRVTDSSGATDTAEAVVAVRDSRPPALAMDASPHALWPPNHRPVPVRINWFVGDLCDPAPTVRLVSVTGNEPDDAPGEADGRKHGLVGVRDVRRRNPPACGALG
jgi:hypothetical protein